MSISDRLNQIERESVEANEQWDCGRSAFNADNHAPPIDAALVNGERTLAAVRAVLDLCDSTTLECRPGDGSQPYMVVPADVVKAAIEVALPLSGRPAVTSDETIQQAAKVIDDILSADPQVAREMFGDEPDKIARALAEAGLLAPTMREEWATRFENGHLRPGKGRDYDLWFKGDPPKGVNVRRWVAEWEAQ